MSSQPPFSLLETMRWEQGVALLSRHLSRSEAAATALDFEFDKTAIHEAFQQHEASLDKNVVYRLRLTINRRGGIQITSSPIDPDVSAFRRVVLSPQPWTSQRPLAAYKTTDRAEYENAHEGAVSKGFDEAILLNERDEVVEGSRTNVWIRRAGRWLTPVLESGCLPGVFRAHLLDTLERAAEATLTVDDLVGADQVAVSNAVHGLSNVEFLLNC